MFIALFDCSHDTCSVLFLSFSCSATAALQITPRQGNRPQSQIRAHVWNETTRDGRTNIIPALSTRQRKPLWSLTVKPLQTYFSRLFLTHTRIFLTKLLWALRSGMLKWGSPSASLSIPILHKPFFFFWVLEVSKDIAAANWFTDQYKEPKQFITHRAAEQYTHCASVTSLCYHPL